MIEILIQIAIVLLSFVALAMGASWMVDAAARIARFLGISELVIGLTVVAFGTSAPEFAVSVAGAVTGNSDVSVGNIVGSNIFNIGFILGSCAVLTTIVTSRALVWRDTTILLGITALLFVFLSDLSLSRLEGIIMFVMLILYLIFLFMKKEVLLEEELPTQKAHWKDIPLFIMGVGLIVVGGYFLVQASVKLASVFGVDDYVISVTVVAAGTSVPEMVTSLVALMKKHHGMSAGNLIGSNIFNVLGVLGLAAAIQPLTVDNSAMLSMWALIILTFIVLVFLRTAWKIKRWEGIVILVYSVVVWILIIYINWPKQPVTVSG